MESMGQFLVVDSEQMHNGRVQVVNVHGVLRDVVAVIIRRPEGEAFLDPCPCQKYGEATGMVVSPVICSGKLAL